MLKKNDILEYPNLAGDRSYGVVERVTEKTCILWSCFKQEDGSWFQGSGLTEVRFELLEKVGEMQV